MPTPFPHILAFPLQLAILSSEAFPVRLPGLVHVANRVVQHEPVPLQEPLGIECSVEGHQETERGQEFELLTECEADGRKVWEESSTYLARRRSAAKKAKAKSRTEDAETDESGSRIVSWEAPANIGRRYAKVSGDFNPIHLSAPTARILGFPGAIAHGMWTMARSAAELECDWKALCLEVQFKLPVFLPAWVCLHSSGDDREVAFRLTDSGGEKPHLEGRMSKLGS